MEEKYLYQLAELVLPSEVLRYFSIVKIETSSTLFRFHLDEKVEKELSDDIHFESKGFMDAVEVTDFPIRDHKVVLVLRRRIQGKNYWQETDTCCSSPQKNGRTLRSKELPSCLSYIPNSKQPMACAIR